METHYEVAINIGGTFTDGLSSDQDGILRAAKSETTPHDLSIGVINVLRVLAEKEQNVSLKEFLSKTKTIVLGTPVASNTIFTPSDAKTAMINTEGFTDILEQRRVPKASSNWKMPKPLILIPRHMRFGVKERIKSTGEIVIPLDEDSAREAVRKAKAKKAETIAVCLLHSYFQPKHEKRLAEIIREEYPEAKVVLSSDVLPRVGEFERCSTTAIIAYITPVVASFLNGLQKSLKESGFKCTLLVMSGNAGVETTEVATKRAGTTIGSDKSGGPLSAVLLSEVTDIQNVLLADMGGTSYEVTVIPKRKIPTVTRSLIGDQVSAFETVNVRRMGTGGGSIAWLDQTGRLHVDSDSVRADLNPACYSREGEKPTVTDADLILGYISADYFLGGEMTLDANLARKAIEEQIAKPLGIDIVEAAYLIRVTADLAMANQSFLSCVEHGYDPSEFVLLMGGGAGPTHGFGIAKYLKIQKVYIPKMAPIINTLGMLNADYRHDFLQVLYQMQTELDLGQVNKIYKRMEAEGIRILESEGIQNEHIGIIKGADICYYGQATDISASLNEVSPGITLTMESLQALMETFHRNHEEARGFSDKILPVQIINLKLTAVGKREKVHLPEIPVTGQDISKAIRCYREVFFKELGGFVKSPCYYGDKLLPGDVILGPAIIDEKATTIVIPPQGEIIVDKYGNYIGKY